MAAWTLWRCCRCSWYRQRLGFGSSFGLCSPGLVVIPWIACRPGCGSCGRFGGHGPKIGSIGHESSGWGDRRGLGLIHGRIDHRLGYKHMNL